MNYKFTFRISFLFFFTLLITFTAISIISISYYFSKKSIEDLATNILGQVSKIAMNKTLEYLRPVNTFNFLSAKLTSETIIRPDDLKSMEKYFKSVLNANPHFVMQYYGNKEGDFLLVKRMSDGSLSTKRVSRQGDRAFTTWEHTNKKYNELFKNIDESLDKAYDPRNRPWYKKALKEKKISWTDIYIFYSDKKPGISCSIPIIKNGQVVGVMSIDLGISEISKFISKLKIEKNGEAFIIDSNGKFVAHKNISTLIKKKESKGKETYNREHILYADPLLSASFLKISDKLSINLKDMRKVNFEYSGKKYYALYSPMPRRFNFNWDWIVGVIVPEDDFMSTVHRNSLIIILVSLGSFLLSIIICVIVANRTSKPIQYLVKEANRIKNFDLSSKFDMQSRFIEIDNMIKSFKNMVNGLKSFEKYVPAVLVRSLIKSGIEAKLGGEKKELTVFFSDISKFTSISEKMSAENLVKLLSEYLGEMSAIILKKHGTVDKYIGDAIMAFWGAPKKNSNHAVDACLSAIYCQKHLSKLRKKWKKEGLPELYIRIGINTGELVVGNIGHKTRFDYTVIGDSVNLSSRLEGANKIYGTNIIISGNTFLQVKESVVARKLDNINVKGKNVAVPIYELVGEKGEVSRKINEMIELFENGLEMYKGRKWVKALKLFKDIHKKFPDDGPTKIYIDRCESFIKKPPPDDWNNVYVMETK